MELRHAEQIAVLLNSRNELTKRYDAEAVMKESHNYVYRIENDSVTACVEVKPVQWYQAEICHLTVHPDFERRGYAKQLLAAALDRAKSQLARIAQCTIREGNIASENLFSSFGFAHVASFRNEKSSNNVYVWQKVIIPAL